MKRNMIKRNIIKKLIAITTLSIMIATPSESLLALNPPTTLEQENQAQENQAEQGLYLVSTIEYYIEALILADAPVTELQRHLEHEVIRLVNEIRRDHDLPELVFHPDLARIARLRTDTMIEHNAVGHRCPVIGLEHTEFAHYHGLVTSWAGENAHWGGRTPQVAVYHWMNSPIGHREFILSGLIGDSDLQRQWENVNLHYIGVGVSWGDNHTFGTAWTLWKKPASN
ncbi:MAG: CAP domain-containing protein [Defluviitaleaceae bacterium]|nr:CAP domain-containing protein [Defluviitaleaceae bacterium]